MPTISAHSTSLDEETTIAHRGILAVGAMKVPHACCHAAGSGQTYFVEAFVIFEF